MAQPDHPNDGPLLPLVQRLYRDVFHEISNPIGGSLGCVEALRSGYITDPAELNEYLDAIRDGLRRTQALNTAFRTVMRSPNTLPRPLQVQALLSDLRLLTAKALMGAQVTWQVQPVDSVLIGDPVTSLRVLVGAVWQLVDSAPAPSSLQIDVATHTDAAQITLGVEGVEPSADIERLRTLGNHRIQVVADAHRLVLCWPG